VQRSVWEDDSDPKPPPATGAVLAETDKAWLRFVDGRPVSGVVSRSLSWCSGKLAAVARRFWYWCGTEAQLAHEQGGASVDREAQPGVVVGCRSGVSEDYVAVCSVVDPSSHHRCTTLTQKEFTKRFHVSMVCRGQYHRKPL
jgi:hypothetical protein